MQIKQHHLPLDCRVKRADSGSYHVQHGFELSEDKIELCKLNEEKKAMKCFRRRCGVKV